MISEELTPIAISISSGVTVICAAAIYYYFTSKNRIQSPNPFEYDTRESSRPYEDDKVKRDGVLKNGYSSKKLSMIGSDFDAIIIGSGEIYFDNKESYL